MMGRLEQGLGILLVLIILLDIFLTVLYARIGTSIIGSRVGRLIWASFVKVSKVFGSRAVFRRLGSPVLARWFWHGVLDGRASHAVTLFG